MNTFPLIHTTRSRAGHLFDITLTMVGWLFFITLFASGILSLLRRDMHGQQEVLASLLGADTTRTLMIYALFALINAVLLFAWAHYNHRRFADRKRRKQTLSLPDERLQDSFKLSPGILQHVHSARAMVISHQEDSAIPQITIIGQPHLAGAMTHHRLPRQHPSTLPRSGHPRRPPPRPPGASRVTGTGSPPSSPYPL